MSGLTADLSDKEQNPYDITVNIDSQHQINTIGESFNNYFLFDYDFHVVRKDEDEFPENQRICSSLKKI